MAQPAKLRAVPPPIYTAKTYHTEESVGFLLGRCMNRITDAIDASLAELGVGSEQFGVLHAIYRGKAGNPSELARLRFRNSANITYTLDVLEQKNLLVRKRSAQDRRVVELELTEEGKTLTRACLPLMVEAQNQVLGGVTREEYQTLSALLRRIAEQDTP
jgi:DNA-binding MarR family transcriptional regulator